MSACISRRGEFSYHQLNADYVCTWCGVLDEDALIGELNRLRDAPEAAHRLGYVRALADVHTRVVTELRSTAKRVPVTAFGRQCYRKGLRRVWDIVDDLLQATK